MTRLRMAAAAAVAVATLLTGCASTANTAQRTPVASATFAGFPLDVPVARPHATLTDDTGQPYDLWARTHGKVTVLYVGYTHCPDLCPMIMATVARALEALPAADRARIVPLFVTADPARDTPSVLHRWLARFSPDIRGLTGSPAALRAVYTALGMPAPALQNAADPDSIEHAASLYVFGHDDVARLAYDADSTVDGLAADLRKVLAGKRPAPVDDSTLAATGGTSRLGLLRVVGAFLDVAPDGSADLTFTAAIDAASPDALVQVSGPGNAPGELRRQGHQVAQLTIPTSAQPPLVLDRASGVHLQLPPAAARQRAIDLRLTFAHSGTMLLRVPIRAAS